MNAKLNTLDNFIIGNKLGPRFTKYLMTNPSRSSIHLNIELRLRFAVRIFVKWDPVP